MMQYVIDKGRGQMRSSFAECNSVIGRLSHGRSMLIKTDGASISLGSCSTLSGAVNAARQYGEPIKAIVNPEEPNVFFYE